jgi:hypothetical protein
MLQQVAQMLGRRGGLSEKSGSNFKKENELMDVSIQIKMGTLSSTTIT